MMLGRATPVARLLMLFWTAGVSPAHLMCRPEAGGPEDKDAPLEWCAPNLRRLALA